jgi:hypothetical protein
MTPLEIYQEKLEECNDEIEGLVARRDFTNHLGSSSSVGGRTRTYSDALYFDKKLMRLKAERQYLRDMVSYLAGESGNCPVYPAGVNILVEAR